MKKRAPIPLFSIYPYLKRSRGQSAILVALLMVMLVSTMALGVDGARFYAEGLRVQKAADEAALAAVTQSGDLSAESMASDVVTRNLNLTGGVTADVTALFSTNPINSVTVTVQEKNFPLLFAPVFGLKSATITRQSSAQYSAPLPMGNPSNTLGDPNQYIDTFTPASNTVSSPTNLMLSINGPDHWTEAGDPYEPLYVLSDPPVVGPTPSVPEWYTMKNPFRASASPKFDGYDYQVSVPPISSTTPQTFTTYIQVYDAETCAYSSDPGISSNSLIRAYGPYSDTLTGSPFGLPYPTANAHENLPQDLSTYGPYPTYYRLYWQDPLTGNRKSLIDSSGQVISGTGGISDTFPEAGAGTMPADTIIAPTSGRQDNGTCDANTTMKWYTLARVKANVSGTYILNVNTCLTSGYDPYAYPNPTPTPSSGTTRYSDSVSGNHL